MICNKNFRVQITNQRQNGPKPSQLKSSQFYCRPSPNSRRLNWVTGPTSWSRHLREWRTDQQVKGSIAYARELLEYELKETERLNAMIVKQTRHCAELKAWEEAEEARRRT